MPSQDSGKPKYSEREQRGTPQSWETRRLKSCVSDVVDLTAQRTVDDIYVALENVESWTGRVLDPVDDVSFESQVKRFKAGDVLFGKLRPYLAKVARPQRNGVCVGEFLVLRADDAAMEPRYLELLMRSRLVIDEVNASTFGAKMPRADWRFIGNMSHAIPPLDEQAAIVRYLDHANELANRYISTKERLIALLEEQRQGVINQAVTRGIDPTVDLKEMQTPWAEQIPVHWESRRLKSSVAHVTEPSHVKRPDDICLSLENVQSWTGCYQVAEEAVTFESQAKRFKPNDVLFGKLRPYLAKVALPDKDGVCVGEFLVLRAKPDVMQPRYLQLLLSTKPAIDEINSSTFGAKMPRAEWRFIGNMVHPLPPVPEQDAIVKHVDRTDSAIAASVDTMKREIALIEEYRTRLIADVVTGQLDFSDAVVELPSSQL